MAGNQEQKWNQAMEAFEGFITSPQTPVSNWLFSLVDPSLARKTRFLTFVKDRYCKALPYAIFSLEPYSTNLNHLFSAILETPPIRSVIPGRVFSSYKSETANALVDLSKKSLHVANQDVHAYPGGSITDTSVNQTSNLDAEGIAQLTQLIQGYSEIYSESRISELWLAAVEQIKLPPKYPLILMLDDFDAFEGDAAPEVRKLFWNTMLRGHGLNNALRVVVASARELRIPFGWKNWGGATAVYL